MIDALRESDRRKGAAIKETFQQSREEIKDKMTEQMEVMQTDMNTKRVNIYNELEKLFQTFMNDSKETFRQYTAELEMNTNDSKAIDETVKKIARMKEKIKLMSMKIYQMEHEFREKNNQIKAENDEIARNFLALKNKMFKFRAEQNKNLTRLSCNTKLAVEQLSMIHKQGEEILRNTELCRKLEFEDEKIRGPSQLPDIEETEIYKLADDASKRELQLYERCFKFENFRNYMKKYNKVLLDKLAAEKEQKLLLQENQILKKQLEAFAEGVTITNRTLAEKENSLFTASTKAFSEAASFTSGSTTIEGVFEIRKIRLQNKNL